MNPLHLACAAVAVAVAVATATACAPEVACTDLAAFSVSAVVVDERGIAIQGATVTYTVNGSEEAPCDAIDNGYACGIEQVGTIVVFARKDGFADASAQATVVQDDLGCHVVTEVVQLVLVADTPA
jgi:hypothetical protein